LVETKLSEIPMLNHRDKGYATLHKLILLSSVFIWFWISLDLWDSMDYSLINLPWNYALVALAGLTVATFGSLQQYGAFFMKNGWERIRESLIKANFQTALIAFFVFASYFATKDNETSRLFLLFYISTSWPILASFNFALPGLFKRLIGFQVVNRKSLIIGDSMSLDSLRKWIKRHTKLGFSFEGMFTTDEEAPSFAQIPLLDNKLKKLEKYLSENKIHQLILLPNSNMDKWIRVVSDLGAKHGCRILVYNNLSGYFDSRLVFVEESGRQFFTLQNEPLESPFNQMVKRSFDLLISVPALVFVLPPCMLMVKLFQSIQSPGPLFFKQERVGMAGQSFTIWKFRSMTFAKDGERDESEQAHPGDERIFAFGAFIRRFSIDEIPQFINVFSGEMSLVGPRPYLAKHDFLFERDYKAYRIRQFVKPGITGPAQCRGLRGEFTDPELLQKRIELDFNYVGNWTIWLDCEIVLRTIIQVLFPPKSAY
jgi:putative colanic acid biosynthesis UDP-glucose lipid carrier transferase